MKSDSHRIGSLLVAQFFGAFNDNAWKLVVTFLAVRSLQGAFVGDEASLQQAVQFQTTLTFSVLVLPLVLFSLPAGVLADRVSKRHVIVAMKLAEVLLMLAATLCLLMAPGNILLPLVLLGLMGAQSALFSPAKYGILPEIVVHESLSKSNALLEMWTFLAIILGTAAGGVLLDFSGSRFWITSGFLTLFALVGFIYSLGIPRVPAARSEGNLIETIRSAWSAICTERILKLAVAGSIVYWTIASLMGQDVLVYAKTVLNLSDSYSGIPLAAFGLGVGAGSLLAGKLSGPKVEYGLIPLGAIGMTVTALLLALLSPAFAGLLGFMALLGVASGFIIVPLNALIQWRSPADRRGAVIALANVFVFTGILLGSVGATVLAYFYFSPQIILLVASLALFAGTVWAVWILPDALLRLLLILLTHSFYRLTVLGRDNVPPRGSALLVSNHVSFVDALILIATLDRPIRFLVERSYFEHWALKPFMKSLGVIPISSSGGARAILRALRDAGQYLDQGEIVCIFPEGEISRTGGLLPFRRGVERIAKNRTAPIIPIYLDGLWGSVFSYEGGRFLFKMPKRLPYPVTVAFGKPLDPETPLSEVRQTVQELGFRAWTLREKDTRALHVPFVKAARRRPLKFVFADHDNPRVSRIKALTGAIVLARMLKDHWKDQMQVGILLPPTVAGALVNIAASIAGRVSVNLNYTAGKTGMQSAIRQSELKSIISSRRFVQKAELELPANADFLWLEEIKTSVRPGLRWTSLLAALFLPLQTLERVCGRSRPFQVDDVATVIFTSGSSGEPKGVMLTHFNIASNVEAVSQVLRVSSGDRVLGILPLFHSFGYMALWFVACKELAMPFHANPLDAPAVGELVHRYRVTVLLATPTFLQIYMRRCTPVQFGSIRLILAGAEKLSESVALAFEDKFGIRPLEGYGCTECAPVIAISVPGFRAPGLFQPGSRRGFVGHPLPGVVVKIVDPETFEPLPRGTSGMLLVKGPNVMEGYLGREDLTEQALQNGFYVTGDIAEMDEDGFLKITDRLSRFSKIGGEMVPHGRIEEALNQAAGSEQQLFAVTAVAHDRKGEILAVIHTCDEDRIPEVLEKLAAMGLPNLFMPRRDHFLWVEQLPLLGTGKLDLREIKRLAEQSFGGVRN